MTARERATRPGRNDPCPCGSGKKLKKCHLGREPHVTTSAQVDPAYRQRRLEAARIQRERQQGLGKPIISANLKGERFVAVKNRLFHSERFKTFHDFLVRYAMTALGPAWGTTELRKREPERHPIALWYQALCRHQRKYMGGSGKVASIPYSGGTAAFMHLAYDLYSLDHNAELQERLLTRLRNPQGFPGARYETYVAAVFIRAGFDLVFENEQDGSTTHCEFTAARATRSPWRQSAARARGSGSAGCSTMRFRNRRNTRASCSWTSILPMMDGATFGRFFSPPSEIGFVPGRELF